MKTFQLALRNLARNRRRTVITLLGIAFSLAIIVFGANFQTGTYDIAVKSGISQLAGHVVIQAKGYQEKREDGLLVQGTDEMVNKLEAEFPDGTVLRRIFLQGVINSATNTSMVALTGLEPDKEELVGELHTKLVAGEWLDEDDRSIVIGQKMSESLGVEIGDRVVYMGQHGDNETYSRLFRVRGIIRTGLDEIDAVMAATNLAGAQDVLQLGDVAHQVTLHIERTGESEAATARVRGLLGEENLEILSWKGALPELYALMQVDKSTQDKMMAILMLIAAIGVLNTILMSVLERTREFGVLLAIGLKPAKLARLVVLEGVLLGVIGTVIGVLLGVAITIPAAKYGIDMSASLGEGYEVAGVMSSTILKATYDWERTFLYAVMMTIFTVLATIYPAWWLTTLKPVDAMRHH
jgi:ABC-type lipoprotein release transport system permease subunit